MTRKRLNYLATRVRRTNSERGFTLIEISAAVVLILFAFTTLTTLQLGFVDNYIRERSMTKAALYAQYLLTPIEVANKPPDEGQSGGLLEDALRQAGYFEQLDPQSVQEEMTRIKGWMVRWTVTRQAIPPIEDALRRIDMTIIWSNHPRDQFQITYYARGLQPG